MTMKYLKLILWISVALTLCQCKSTKNMVNGNTMGNMKDNAQLDTATIVLPIKGRTADIRNFIQTTFSEFSFGETGDDLRIKAQIREGIEIDIQDDSVALAVPMDVHIVKETFLTNIEADGALIIKAKMSYDVDSAWNVVTQTRIVGHEWIEKPEAKVSVIKLSIESVADKLIVQNAKLMAVNIDAQISRNLNLRKNINDMWYRLRSPMLVSETYKVWVQLKPVGFNISKLTERDEVVEVRTKFQVTPKVFVGSRPVDFELDSLPSFEWLTSDDPGYLVPLRLSIPDNEISDITNQYLDGEVFDLGKKKISVKNVDLQREGERWKVTMDVVGDLDGAITMKGKPVYNERRDQLELDDFDYAVSSKNILLKSSAVLFKQRIEKTLVNKINEIIEERKQEFVKTVEDQLVMTNKNQWLDISNEFDQIKIQAVGLDEDGLWMYVMVVGDAQAQFKYQRADNQQSE